MAVDQQAATWAARQRELHSLQLLRTPNRRPYEQLGPGMNGSIHSSAPYWRLTWATRIPMVTASWNLQAGQRGQGPSLVRCKCTQSCCSASMAVLCGATECSSAACSAGTCSRMVGSLPAEPA